MENLITFLEVALHSILYERGIYPRSIFQKLKAYDIGIYWCRHPGVNEYISSTLNGLRDLYSKGFLKGIVMTTSEISTGCTVDEIFFSLTCRGSEKIGVRDTEENPAMLFKLHQQLRSLLVRISTSINQIGPYKQDAHQWSLCIDVSHDSDKAAKAGKAYTTYPFYTVRLSLYLPSIFLFLFCFSLFPFSSLLFCIVYFSATR